MVIKMDVSNADLRKEWEEIRRRQKQPLPPTVGTNAEGKPIDAQGVPLSYESMRTEFNKRRGISHENGSTIDSMNPEDENRYQKLRKEFYNRIGREPPEVKTAQWQNRLKKDEEKYSR